MALPSVKSVIPGSGGFVSLFARHPNAANLVMILMIIFGIFAIGRINTQFFPTIETDSVTVSVAWSGASAEDVETNILKILEPEIRFIDNVDRVTSYAREGSGTISLEFAAGSDMQKAVADVESAVKTVTNLPEDADEASIKRSQFFDRVARLALTGDVPEAALRIYAKIIRDDLIERGIDKVSFVGMRNREMQVTIPEAQLRRLGLTVSDISKTISENSRDLPSGQMKGDVEQQIRTVTNARTPSALERLEIKAFSSGEKVLLGDVATVLEAYEDGQTRGFSGGKKAIQLTIERAPTADTLATAKILDDYLVDLEKALPDAVDLKKYEVRADSLLERINLLLKNGLGGLFLVVITLFIFLNARIAFWVAAGIPVAMLATIGLMLIMGQTINMISLFGLIMMLGVIVDDAIVVGEHTATRFAEGDGPYEAAENGAGRMVAPVMAAMITTAAAFAPMLLIRDVIGQIMGAMPLVVLAVIVASLVECFLILPGHLAHTLQAKPKKRWSYLRNLFFSFVIGVLLLAITNRVSVGGSAGEMGQLFSLLAEIKANNSFFSFIMLLTAGSLIAGTIVEFAIFGISSFFSKNQEAIANPQQENRFRRWFDGGFAKFRDGIFTSWVTASYRYRYATLSVAISSVLIVVLGLFVWGGHLKFVFFPSPEAENIRARMVFNAGIKEDDALAIINEVEKSLYDTVDRLGKGEELVSAVFITLGSAGRNTGDNLAEMRVQLTSSETRTIRTRAIVRAWKKNLPKIAGARRLSVFESRAGPPGRDIDLELYGQDVGLLKQAAGEVADLVSALPGVSGVSDDLPYGKPELVMALLPRGAALGFTLDSVSNQVRQAFDGSIARRFADGDDEVAIRVSRLASQSGNASLRDFELRSTTGDFVPLTEVVKLTERQGFAAIQRKDGKTAVSVTADLDTDIITTEDAIEQLRNSKLDAVLSKYGFDYAFRGRAEERAKAFVDLAFGVTIALAVIYIVLAWVFSDYWRPIAIMLIIPFGLVGAVFGHWLLDYKLTILSMIGLLGLSGILVNDSIILVSRLDERLKMGEKLEAACIGASRDRLRAVLLTSLTTIGGLIPLLFEKSVQAQFLLPMAITIVFGLALATLLVLFLVPAFIGIGGDIGNAVKWVFSSNTRLSSKPAAE